MIEPFAALLRGPLDAARSHHTAGGLVVGYLCTDVPEELILAAGAMPLHMRGDVTGQTPLADEYIKPGFNPLARAVFDRILDGSYAFLDRIIFSNLDESFVRLFYLTREIKRQGLSTVIPDIYFFEYLHSPHCLDYNRDRLHDFKQRLETWTGRPITDKSLRAAIAICNENRQLVAQLSALRVEFPPRISGSAALQIIASAALMPRVEHSAALREFLSSVDKPSAETGAARLYVMGHVVDNLSFYQMVESCGATIVAEDWTSRHFDGLTATDGDPLDAINQRYFSVAPYASKSSIIERVDYLLKQVEVTQVDGVIFVLPEGEHPPHWDYPEQRKALEARGIPSLYLPWQPATQSDSIREQVRTFVHGLKAEALP